MLACLLGRGDSSVAAAIRSCAQGRGTLTGGRARWYSIGMTIDEAVKVIDQMMAQYGSPEAAGKAIAEGVIAEVLADAAAAAEEVK